MAKTKTFDLDTGDKVRLKNGRSGYVVDVIGAKFCIRYDDTGMTQWVPVSSVVSKS